MKKLFWLLLVCCVYIFYSCDKESLLDSDEVIVVDPDRDVILNGFSGYPKNLDKVSATYYEDYENWYITGLVGSNIWVGEYSSDKKNKLSEYEFNHAINNKLEYIDRDGLSVEYILKRVGLNYVYKRNNKYIYEFILKGDQDITPTPWNLITLFTDYEKITNVWYANGSDERVLFFGEWYEGYVVLDYNIYSIEGNFQFKPLDSFRINGEMKTLHSYDYVKTSFDQAVYISLNNTLQAGIHKISLKENGNDGLIWEVTNKSITNYIKSKYPNCYIGEINVITNLETGLITANCLCGWNDPNHQELYILQYDIETGKLLQ